MNLAIAVAGIVVAWAGSACSGDGIESGAPDATTGTVTSGTSPSGTGDAGTGGAAAAGTTGAGPAGVTGGATPSGDAGGTLVVEGGAQDASSPAAVEEDTEIRNVDVSNDVTRRFGAPHVAVNPTNPDNIVVIASANLGYTKQCVAEIAPGSPCEPVAASVSFGGIPVSLDQPRGVFEVEGFSDIGVFVTFDRGRSWKTVDTYHLHPPDHPEVNSKGEGPVVVMPDGTFYIAFNAINWGSPEEFYPNGGVGVIKSTDGGSTWEWAGLTGTPADWPYGDIDLSTSTFYMTSGISFSALGPRSTGDPNSPEGDIGDRWIASSQDGVHWTDPQPLGEDFDGEHSSTGHTMATAAHGIVAAMWQGVDPFSCQRFLPDAPLALGCMVFQTSTDAGATWERHRVPTPGDFTPAGTAGQMISADPTHKGHFTVTMMRDDGSEFWVWHTPDRGKSWVGPTKVSDDPSKGHFAPFPAYSPTGEYGLMWRTFEPDPANPDATAPNLPYSVWAVLSKDGGKTFSKPLKVSKANSPPRPDNPDDAFREVGDHGPSGMAIDAHGHAYVVWADWSPGERAIFFGSIPLQLFEF